MSHVVVPNFQLLNGSEIFHSVWKLTRAMLAAGWRYKASGDALAKDTTASASADKWAVGGAVNYVQVGAQTGTAPTIGAPTAGVSVISSVSGFTANSVGRFLVISGSINANNNGAFRITAQGGTTVSVFNPGAVAESALTATVWKEVQGGATGSIAASGTGGATPGRAIVSGLTGMVAPTSTPLSRGSVGDHLTIIGAATGANNGTFRIIRYISATSVEIDNGSATADANNGALVWVESSPLAQTYPVSLQGATGAGAWLVLQGPSSMKIPISTNVPTGAFVRGERVTATTSGATGTILGVMTDTSGGTGFLVIMPRLNGTGGGPRGWTTGATDTITGALSGATITSSTAAPIEFVREMVFWKSTQAAGHIYLQTVDQNLESASRFSTIAANAGITATIAPGSSAAGGFPTAGSWVLLGTGNVAAVTTTPIAWYAFLNTMANPVGNLHVMCADCMETSLTDADGSWIVALGQPTDTVRPGSYSGMCFQRVDGSEDGDVDPYVAQFNVSGSAYTGTRLGPSTTVSNYTDYFDAIGSGGGFGMLVSTISFFAGWRRRGFALGDAWQQFQGMCLTTGAPQSPISTTFTSWIGRTQNSNQEAFVREALWVASVQTSQRMRKGYLRWMWLTEGGSTNNTYLGATWIQLATSLASSLSAPMIVGPWDGQTVPFQA